nr:12645_t:CDS:2 [Entrophospora candida]
MLKQDGYYSPVNNTYLYFTDEEYEENKKLRSKFKESDKINAKVEPYVEKEKNKDAFYFSRLMNYKEQISKALGNTKQSQHEKSQELKTSDNVERFIGHIVVVMLVKSISPDGSYVIAC